MQPIYIGIGTNLGNRERNLNEAIDLLLDYVQIIKKSSIYETDPWGYKNQPKFLNLTIEISTTLSPEKLLTALKSIEVQVGRKKTFRYGPRVIDLDILFYGDSVIHTGELQVPHPKIQDRAFVLVPLCEIAEGFMHPTLNQSIQNLLKQIEHDDVVRFENNKDQEIGINTYEK